MSTDEFATDEDTNALLGNSHIENWPQWDTILDFIETGNCILMLGPDLSVNTDENLPHSTLFTNTLKPQLGLSPDDEISFEKATERFRKECTTSVFNIKIAKYYREIKKSSKVHKYISGIPFPLIINTAPDNLLVKEYDNYISDYYNYSKNRIEPASSGQQDLPLIYNLFGSAVEPESLVLTEKDRLDFLFKVLTNDPPLPQNLLGEKLTNDRNMILFVGFNFKEWYLRLIVKILSLNDKRFSCAIDERMDDNHQDTKIFFTKNFRIHFLELSDDLFLKRLHEKYQERNPFHQTQIGDGGVQQVIVKQEVPPSMSPPSVFISADKKEQKYVMELEKILHPAIINKKLKTWHYGKIKHGDEKQQTSFHLENAKVIVICLSPGSIRYNIDQGILQKALKRKEQGENIKVIGVVLRSCLYDQVPQLKKVPLFPKVNDEILPVNDKTWGDQADALKLVADQIINRI